MFICEECGEVFENGPCPACGSDNYDEADFCKVCSTWKPVGDMSSMHCCKECADEHMDEETILRYIEDCKMDADFYVEFYTGSEFSWISHNWISETLVLICKEDFQKKDKPTRLQYLREFASEDLEHFAEWLESV